VTSEALECPGVTSPRPRADTPHVHRVALLLAVLWFCSACASTGAVPKPFPVPGSTGSTGSSGPPAAAIPGRERADPYALVGTALSLRGIPYRNGGSDPGGFDCSGFTQYVFAKHGIGLARDVREQFRQGRAVEPRDVAPGDLVFFSTSGPGASHVGIVVGGDEFIHAPSSSGVVRVERIGSSYWAPRFIGARRIP
jgi:cell wall-associated NlpC family hydrolase